MSKKVEGLTAERVLISKTEYDACGQIRNPNHLKRTIHGKAFHYKVAGCKPINPLTLKDYTPIYYKPRG